MCYIILKKEYKHKHEMVQVNDLLFVLRGYPQK